MASYVFIDVTSISIQNFTTAIRTSPDGTIHPTSPTKVSTSLSSDVSTISQSTLLTSSLDLPSSKVTTNYIPSLSTTSEPAFSSTVLTVQSNTYTPTLFTTLILTYQSTLLTSSGLST